MKIVYFFLILAVVVGLAGCLNDNTGPEYLVSWASADSVEVLSVRALAVEFDVFGAKPTPCYEIIEPLISEDANEKRVTVEMRSRIRREVICIQMLGSHQTRVLVPVSESGAWEFAFHSNLEGEPIVIGVTVPD
jgi:hypothetical protein